MPIPPGGEPTLHFTKPANNSSHGNVLKVGRGVSAYWDLQPPNSWPEHRHSAAQLVLALDPVDATMTWRAKGHGRRADCTVPHFWYVPPDTPHSAEWRGTSGMLVLYVEQEFIREECGCDLDEGLLFSLAPFIHQDYLVSRICRRFHDLCHRRQHYSDPIALAGALLLAAAVLKSCLSRLEGTSPGLSARRFDAVADCIEKRMREALTPAILSAAAGLSEHHFSRMFRRSTGTSPMKYVWRCRLHRARQLLETGEWKVAQVAVETGFYDQSHLDRQFRKEFGCTPGAVIPVSVNAAVSRGAARSAGRRR